MVYNVIIVGAGAAGLAACARLANTRLNVLLVERNPRVGKKLLSTGNGRCNLSNEDMDPSHYYEAESFVRKLYEAVSPGTVLSFFESLGLMTSTEDGRIYPRTMAAASVLDLLRNAINASNITVKTDTKVIHVESCSAHRWIIQTSNNDTMYSRSLLLATGGSAAPKTGSDGSGFNLLKQMNLPFSRPVPALVQLKSSHCALRSLKGIRVQAQLTLSISGEPQRFETGELLFTDYGISGICVFQLSRYVPDALARGKDVHIFVNFLPELDPLSVRGWLQKRFTLYREGEQIQNCFTGVFQRMLTLAILKEAGINPTAPLSELSPVDISALTKAIIAFPLKITGTLDFDSAQVTRGGLPLDMLNPRTMEVFSGMYAAGEIVNCDGPCGGYNLHFAFASGLAAADAILSSNGNDTSD